MNHLSRTHRLVPRALAAACLGALSSWSAASQAIPEYAQAISDRYGICVPQCTLCHQTTQGGAETTDPEKPFYVTVAPKGIRPGATVETLNAVLTALETEMVDNNGDGTPDGLKDSDGDGVADTAELAAEQDPNVAGAGQLCGTVTYGCGARIAPARNVDPLAVAAALGAALALGALRRRQR